jgi:hypothetical protein
MTKIVINTCFGGFSLSKAAQDVICELKGEDPGEWVSGSNFYTMFDTYNLDRSDPDLVAAVNLLGDAAWGDFSQLKVVEIPDSVDWYIEEYDGREWVAERHRTWN